MYFCISAHGTGRYSKNTDGADTFSSIVEEFYPSGAVTWMVTDKRVTFTHALFMVYS